MKDAASFEAALNAGPTRRGRAVMRIKERTERRELAHRTNDGFDVTLFWSKASNRVTISVFHARSTTALEFEVDRANALHAFDHPYAYAAAGGANTSPPTLPSDLDHQELAG
jgi:hypothetical protein